MWLKFTTHSTHQSMPGYHLFVSQALTQALDFSHSVCPFHDKIYVELIFQINLKIWLLSNQYRNQKFSLIFDFMRKYFLIFSNFLKIFVESNPSKKSLIILCHENIYIILFILIYLSFWHLLRKRFWYEIQIKNFIFISLRKLIKDSNLG